MENPKIVTNQDKYNLLAGRVPMTLNRFLSQSFKANDIILSREQWTILAILWKEEGISQQAIADATYRDKPSTTRLIDNLEKQEFIERRPHARDRRQNLIYLTPKGKAIEKQIMEVVNQTIIKATEGLSDQQIATIRDSFEIIYENIKKALLL